MKVVILTNKTSHHLYFLHQLLLDKRIEIYPIFEKNVVKFPFKTRHSLEVLRNRYENQILKKKNIQYSSIKKKELKNVNSKTCINLIKKINPKLIISYGVGKIRGNFLKNFGNKTFNLHGGDPENYRGLDSFLWAIYHKDFNNFYITLHKVSKKLDTGDIIYKKKIILNQNTNIYNLRLLSANTCISLAKKIIKQYLFLKKHKTQTQNKKKGKYYSAMPSVLKNICMNNFKSFLKKKYGR